MKFLAEIERDVPCPIVKGRWLLMYPLGIMEVGESFVVSNSEHITALRATICHIHQRGDGKRFITRRHEGSGIRIWRIENIPEEEIREKRLRINQRERDRKRARRAAARRLSLATAKKALADIGGRGGKRGGKAKRRGNSAYYRELSKLSAAARKK